MTKPSYELIVIGSTPDAVSIAAEASRAGLSDILLVTDDDHTVPADSVARYRMTVRFGTKAKSVESIDDETVAVVTSEDSLTAYAVAVVAEPTRQSVTEIPFLPDIAERVHLDTSFEPDQSDVLVVGSGPTSVGQALDLVDRGARVVLCYTGTLSELSTVGERALHDAERTARITVLWESEPASIEEVGGLPMVHFPDRRTPDLQFDHVVLDVLPGVPEGLQIDDSPRVLVVGTPDGVVPARAWEELRARIFPDRPVVTVTQPEDDARAAAELAESFYNGVITHFDTAHNELWRIRVKPDQGSTTHRPGQYVTLGLGYWEPRVDGADEVIPESRQQKLIRRSYSISSQIFDNAGYLVNAGNTDEIELYVVQVAPDADRIPALTPRLALKNVGDRIYVGPKIAGRYTLDHVTDPATPVVFLGTGTGEAPHNEMVVELLSKGHHGPILHSVTVRYWSDLAYREEHTLLEGHHPNYKYLPIPTREPDVSKRYVQDLLVDGTLEEELGVSLTPESAQVFLCGNPAMIGLPKWENDQPVFPDTVGMCQLLHERGFDIDRRGHTGNVHFEEYW
ncbi:MAG: hypothetical protein GEU79_09610 [Acidimicrobiia bacterium]|nr:hypothetical protein [Acidimicrobiia bacterium]